MMIQTTVDGRYHLIGRLASGGMGEVYRAHDPVLDREVALKMLHTSLADDPAFIDRFRREARSAATLSHPNIVSVHDWGETQGTYFMVMEFIRGPNLRALLMRQGTLQPPQAIEVTDGVLAALEHAHVQGIVHRDIKPENVMIRASDGVVKVADFGLARAFADSRVSQAPGTVTGTVQYLAPEQIEGHNADPRTDLYATGIVLYELLTGEVPFSGETSVAIAYKHLRERVPPPSTSNPMVPVALDRVVLSATERKREKRTAEARTMREELARASDDLPPAPPLRDIAKTVTPADEVPADRLSTVTIPRTLSPKQRRRKRMARAFQVVSLLAVLAVMGWAVWTYVIPHPTTVPDLRGDPLNVAEQAADAAGLDLVTGGQEYDSQVPAGAVISQNMEPGSEAEEGDLLSVVLSRGPELVPVPQVVGLPEEEARTQLEDARFKVAIQREYHDTIPKGQVIEQTPDPETALEVGKQVRLTVSRGKEPVAVPNVGGNTSAEASALIQGAGLGVRVVQEFSTDVPRDIVIRQIPQADRSVPVGSTVTIVVSKGPQQFPMPTMIGKPASQAQVELEGVGLVVNAVDLPGSTGDEVVGQNPKAGVIVEAGQQVTIYIGGG